MQERIRLKNPRSRKYAPGVSASVAVLDVMGFRIHREPDINPDTGAVEGFKAEGSYLEVDVVGQGGTVETLRLAEDQEALDLMGQLNTANLSGMSLIKRLASAVRSHQVVTGTDPETGEDIVEQPYEGDLEE